MSKHDTHCFDGATAQILAKILQIFPRSMTRKRMNKIQHDGSLEKIIKSMTDESTWKDLIDLIDGRKKVVPTGAYERIKEYFFNGLIKKGMIREQKDVVIFTASARSVFANLNQQAHPSAACKSLDINGDKFEQEIINSGDQFTNIYEIAGIMNRLIIKTNKEKVGPHSLSKKRLNRFPCKFFNSKNMITQLRWENGFNCWILDIVGNGEMLYPYKKGSEKEQVRLFFK